MIRRIFGGQSHDSDSSSEELADTVAELEEEEEEVPELEPELDEAARKEVEAFKNHPVVQLVLGGHLLKAFADLKLDKASEGKIRKKLDIDESRKFNSIEQFSEHLTKLYQLEMLKVLQPAMVDVDHPFNAAALEGVSFDYTFKNDRAEVLRPEHKMQQLQHGDLVVLSSPTDPLFPEKPDEAELTQKLVQAVHTLSMNVSPHKQHTLAIVYQRPPYTRLITQLAESPSILTVHPIGSL